MEVAGGGGANIQSSEACGIISLALRLD